MASHSIQPTDQDWEDNRTLLEDLYNRGTMRDVMDHMKRHFGWDVRRNQYHKWLTKIWKLQKNGTAAEWIAIYPHVRDLQRTNKVVEVWINGRKKSPQAIEKEIRRQLRACPDLAKTTPKELPTGVIVKESSFASMELITMDLPFHNFELHLEGDPPITDSDLQPVHAIKISEQKAVQSNIWAPNNEIEIALQLVVPHFPRLDESFEFSLMAPDTQFFASPLHRNIMFSVANNFAGLDAVPKEQVILFLQRETSEGFYRMIRSVPQYYTTQAIALNLFRAAIDVGDARTVDFLLRESLPGISVNGFICKCYNLKHTPIEKAAGLLHTSVVKILLKHKADVNISHPQSFCHGALECATGHFGHISSCAAVAKIDPELFALLVHAGGQIRPRELGNLIQCDIKGDFTRLIISAQIGENHQHWSKTRIFLKVFQYQSHSVASDILNLMLEHKVNINYYAQVYDYKTELRCVIDTVAQRGDEVLMKKLIEEQVQLTNDTLPCAISSGNKNLVRLLLQHGADVNSMGDLRISPLAAAIRLQSPSMDELIIYELKMSILSEHKMFQSALTAASEAGDLKWIERLVQLGGIVRPADLGTALSIAAKNGKQDIALALIDAGADTNVKSYSSDLPLLEALRQHNSILVHALLDTDANSKYEGGSKQSIIELAVLWGDMEIVESIIRAGADINAFFSQPALNITVQKKNYALFDLLIKAGCDINNPKARILQITALEAAVKSADIAMLRHVIAHGADVHDPTALSAACEQSPNFLDLLLQAHKHQYPNGRPGWGTSVLINAIELNDVNLFKKLISGGADANQFAGTETPFWNAIQQHQVKGLKFVEYLLQEQQKTGCTPETIVVSASSTRYNRPLTMLTAFLAAIGTKSRPLIDLMLRYHAVINFPAKYGVKRTPLQKAAEVGSEEIIRLLLDRGAKVNSAAAQRGGGTALQFAAMNGFIPIVRLLLEAGAEVDAPASKVNGRTALEGAAWQGRLDMVAVLLKAGAASGGNDQAQIQRAIAFAEEDSHFHIAQLLTRYGQTKTLSSADPTFAEEVFDFNRWGLDQ